MRDLAAYAAAALAAWLVAVLLRAALHGGAGAGDAGREPSPGDVAYLTGGPLQAVYAAVAALRSTGSVRAADGVMHAADPEFARAADIDEQRAKAGDGDGGYQHRNTSSCGG